MEKITLNVQGMSCEHCERAVKKAVGAIEGVKSVEVDLSAKSVTTEFDKTKASLSAIKQAIEDEGYGVI